LKCSSPRRQSESDLPINLHIAITWQDRLVISIQDDGIGFDLAKMESSEAGLAMHSTLMAVIGGH
jgi:sensor histidine kinase YesM